MPDISLLGLPTELIADIVTFTLVNGTFENFMLTCKATHAAGQSGLRIHRKWVCTVASEDGTVQSVLQILKAIAAEPIIGPCIKTLDLREAADNDLVEGSSADAEASDNTALIDMVRNSLHMQRTGPNADDWIAAMRLRFSDGADEEDEMWIIDRTVVLLTLLPNLEEVVLPKSWSGFYENGADKRRVMALNLLELMMHEANQSPDEDMPLAKLIALRPYQEIEYDPMPRGALRDVGVFMHLPKMTILNVSNLYAVDDGYTGIPFRWSFEDIPSRIRSIDLAGCCIDERSIAELLSHTPLVTSFKYSHSTKWHGCQHDWDAGAFIKTVAKYTGTKLRTLLITLDELFGDVETGVDFLTNFIFLQDVKLDVAVLAAPSIASGIRHGINPEGGPWNLDELQDITFILPGSIRHVTLKAKEKNDLEALRRLISPADELRLGYSYKLWQGHNFPRLESIKVISTMNLDDMEAADAEAGSKQARLPLRAVLEGRGVQIKEPPAQKASRSKSRLQR